jgi:hypothetical protein
VLSGVFVHTRPNRRHAALGDEPTNPIAGGYDLAWSQDGLAIVSRRHLLHPRRNMGARPTSKVRASSIPPSSFELRQSTAHLHGEETSSKVWSEILGRLLDGSLLARRMS